MDETNGMILRLQRDLTDFDLPPEFCQYRDDGCELAVSCLQCPFPNCIREEQRGERKWRKHRRAREIARMYLTGQKSIQEVAAMFKVSQRTVQRALKMVSDSRLAIYRPKEDEADDSGDMK